MLRPVILALLLFGVAFAATPAEPPAEVPASPSTVALANEQFGVMTFGLSMLVFAAGVVMGERLATL